MGASLLDLGLSAPRAGARLHTKYMANKRNTVSEQKLGKKVERNPMLRNVSHFLLSA